MKRQLIAKAADGRALFIRYVKDKDEVRKEVLNNPFLVQIDCVIYNNKRYNVKEILKP